MCRSLLHLYGLWSLIALVCPLTCAAQSAGDSPAAGEAKKASSEEATRLEAFREAMTEVELTGHFTIQGKEDQPLAKESYTIRSVQKLPRRDYWLFQARIQYGKIDVTLPLPLEVKWAGSTPVITMTEATIPGLGTFSARVVIHQGKYAGTWKHDEVSGHLFGVIEKLDSASAATDDATGSQ
jgi:hypothetical protein